MENITAVVHFQAWEVQLQTIRRLNAVQVESPESLDTELTGKSKVLSEPFPGGRLHR